MTTGDLSMSAGDPDEDNGPDPEMLHYFIDHPLEAEEVGPRTKGIDGTITIGVTQPGNPASAEERTAQRNSSTLPHTVERVILHVWQVTNLPVSGKWPAIIVAMPMRILNYGVAWIRGLRSLRRGVARR